MAIASKTRKLLWSRARDECAFPGCSQALTEDQPNVESGNSDATVVGEEAHIRAQSLGGARYDAEYVDVDGFQNLILLCPTHHTLVDANNGDGYSVDQLIAIKSKHEARQSARDSHQRALRAYIGDRYAAENTVQFHQVDLRGPSVESLFVDVPLGCRPDDPAVAGLIAQIAEASPGDTHELEAASGLIIAGATQVLLHPEWVGNAVIVGGPGQGKSTVLQFICQFHRARRLGTDEYTAGPTGMARDATVGRFPIRIDLRKYAKWAAPGQEKIRQKKRKPRRDIDDEPSWRSLEEFIIEDIQRHIGANEFGPEDLAAVIANEPVLLALDGLDEVASVTARSRVVQEIAQVRGRLAADAADLIILVATRPGSSLQPLTASGAFPVLHLQKLTQGLRLQYLQRWVVVSGLSADASVRLQSTFMDSQHVTHINELASYPMQLAILLHLLHRRQLLPQQRTDLYREYLKTFLDREQTEDKEPLLDERRRVMEDTHAYLGWYLQAKAEQGGTSGSITREELRRLLNSYLSGQPEAQKLADEIYSAITDRVLCLVERDDAFEFEVQSLREYFAALHIFENLTSKGHGNSRDDGLDALIERPYWSNVCRFFVGMLARGEIRAFPGNLRTVEGRTQPHPLARGMAVQVLGDRIYSGLSDADIRSVVDFIFDGPGLLFAEDGILDSTGSPLRLGEKAGRTQAVSHLMARLENETHPEVRRAAARSLAAHAEPDENIADWWWKRFETSNSWLDTAAHLKLLGNLSANQEARLRAVISQSSSGNDWHVENIAQGGYDGSDQTVLSTARAELNDGAAEVVSGVSVTTRLGTIVANATALITGRQPPVPGPRRVVPAAPSVPPQEPGDVPTTNVPSPFDWSRRLNAAALDWGDGWVLRGLISGIPLTIDLDDIDAFLTTDAVRDALKREAGYRANRSDADWWVATVAMSPAGGRRALTVLSMLQHARADVIVKLSSALDKVILELQPKYYRALESALLRKAASPSGRRVNFDDAFRLNQMNVSGPTLWLLWIVATESTRDRVGRVLDAGLDGLLRSGTADARRAIRAINSGKKLKLQLFDETRGVLPQGAWANASHMSAMNVAMAKSVLKRPESWPPDIVQIAVDRVATQVAGRTPPLAEFAAANGWFDD